MSVNGQDPRSNVYLLDGTLLNDFTNGPAGSAAGTALGMETVREFRVETNAYSAEFGRNCGGQINVLTKSGTQHAARQRLRVPPQRRARRARTTSTSPASRTSRATSSAARVGGPLQQDRLFFFVGYEGAARAPRQDDLDASCPTTTRARGHPARRRRSAINPAVRAVPRRDSRAPTARRSAAGSRATPSASIRRSIRTSCRAASTTTLGAAHQFFARYTFDDAEQCLPTDYPQFPRDVPLAQPVLHRRVPAGALVDARCNTARLGFSRTRIGQNVEANTSHAAAAVRARPRARRRHRHRRPASASGRRARRTCGWCRTCSASRTT